MLTTDVLIGQVSFNVNGSWNYTISSNLEAGNDFVGTYTSDVAQAYISATTSKGKGNFNWSISIHRADINWDATMRIYARRNR